MKYTNIVAKVFNSEMITQVCKDIDNNHPQSKELKECLLILIKSSVDLSIPSKAIDPYRKAYKFVLNNQL